MSLFQFSPHAPPLLAENGTRKLDAGISRCSPRQSQRRTLQGAGTPSSGPCQELFYLEYIQPIIHRLNLGHFLDFGYLKSGCAVHCYNSPGHHSSCFDNPVLIKMRNLWIFFLLGFVGCVKGHVVSNEQCGKYFTTGLTTCKNDFLAIPILHVGLLSVQITDIAKIIARITSITATSQCDLEAEVHAKIQVGTVPCNANIVIKAKLAVSISPAGQLIYELDASSLSVQVNLLDAPVIIVGLAGSIVSNLIAGLTTGCDGILLQACIEVNKKCEELFGHIIIGGEDYPCIVKDIKCISGGINVIVAAVIKGVEVAVSTGTNSVGSLPTSLNSFCTSFNFIGYCLSLKPIVVEISLSPHECIPYGYPSNLILILKVSEPVTCSYNPSGAYDVTVIVHAGVYNGGKMIYGAKLALHLQAKLKVAGACFGLSIYATAGVFYSQEDYSKCGCQGESPSIQAAITKYVNKEFCLALNAWGCMLWNPFAGQKPQTCDCNESTKNIVCTVP